MNTRRTLSAFLVAPLLAALAFAQPARPGDGAKTTRDDLATLSDAALAPYQVELLELAFQTASAIPSFPLVKTRSEAQANVVAACIELEQLARARAYAERIENWRRGDMYAQLAFHLAQHGKGPAVQSLLERAEEVAKSLRVEGEDGQPEGDGEQPTDQAWRRDRIRVEIARTHALLGDEAEAAHFEAGVVASEAGRVDGVRAARSEASSFDERLAALQPILAGSDLDQARTAFEVCAQLYDRFYADAERRVRVEQAIQQAEHKLPGFLRIDLWIELAGYALDHGDAAQALVIVNHAKGIAGACTEVRLVARLARLRYVVGDHEKAHAEAETALALYDEQRADIIDIYRAGVLRPLAEAFHVMGDSVAARRVYARALEEGVGNPNSRPRAEDLGATCLSMARNACEPDADLKARLYEIFGKLAEPW
jgi:tetratricopeptide (TPR) repeat protein